MEQAVEALLSGWESFYVIVGSASAALIGLQFVVIVLSAELDASTSDSTTRAFATPTIIHFCAALFIAAVLSAPWPALAYADVALGLCGIAGLTYALMITRQMRQQTDYVPVLEDWVWHCVLPVLTYAVLLAAALFLQGFSVPALFAVGGITLLLLFIGIHNAWDSVVFISFQRRQRRQQPTARGRHR